MTHPTPTGNGCSLEDCHTNLFALTDLVGIKWRKLTSDIINPDPLEDPVLLSFTKCIKSDILCVWRRVQTSTTEQRAPNEQLSLKKELWVFWYGDSPANIDNCLAPELSDADKGNWDQGLPYECRTLLFKALHNLIERCLLSQGFVRMGKWFVQPYDSHVGTTDKSAHLSISFSFFLHGESTVCASIEVRQHPPLRRVTQHHLGAAAHGGHAPVQVILAPYGLSGVLTGQSYKDSEQGTQKLLDEWKQFYPLDEYQQKQPETESTKTPLVVEVVVAGVRMKYPACFVLVPAEMDDMTMHPPLTVAPPPVTSTPRGAGGGQMTPVMSSVPLTPPTSPCEAPMAGETNIKMVNGAYVDAVLEAPSAGVESADRFSHRIVEKVWQDCCLASNSQRSHNNQEQNTSDTENIGTWDFVEPTTRNQCGCLKSKGNKPRPGSLNKGGSTSGGSGKHGKGERTEKLEKQLSRHGHRGAIPFHRRSPVADELLLQDIDMVTTQRMANPAFSSASSSTNNFKGASTVAAAGSAAAVPSNTSLPQLHNTTATTPAGVSGVGGDQSLDSPHSAAPSPLDASHSAPSLSQNTDPTMPTLSPHPPATKNDGGGVVKLENNSASNTKQNESQDASAGGAGAATTTTPGGAAGDIYTKTPGSVAKSENFTSPYQSNVGDSKMDSVSHWVDSHRPPTEQFGIIKRPTLKKRDYEEGEMAEELPTESLYDFNSLNAWFHYSVKRLKTEPRDMKGISIKQEPGLKPPMAGVNNASAKAAALAHQRAPSPAPVEHDPYEFTEESPTSAGHFSMSRPFRSSSRDGDFPRPSPFGRDEDRRGADVFSFGVDEKDMNMAESPSTPNVAPASTNLVRSEDLNPRYSDLDKIFDTSDEDSNDEGLQFNMPVQAPISKLVDEKPPKMAQGRSLSSSTGSGNLGATELSQMYPTPPSHENHTTDQSPCMGTETEYVAMAPEQQQVVVKAEPMTTTPHVEEVPIKVCKPSVSRKQHHSDGDWSFVYKPPVVAKFVSSSKYAPIELPSAKLPSMPLPPWCSYKPSWHQHPLPIIEKHPQPPPPSHCSQYINLPSIENVPSISRMQPDRSPATFHGSNQQRTPMSYELQSPASNASSYMNKNLNSIEPQGTNSQLPEAYSLVVNTVLSDSILNLFKDHNFDSCSICVCNMNIKGADVGLYIADPTNEAQYRCTCGFSAVMNRKLGHNSGLFYEDEVDITGMRDYRYERRKPSLLAMEYQKDEHKEQGEDVPPAILRLLEEQYANPYPSCAALFNYSRLRSINRGLSPNVNLLQMQDGCDASYLALEYGRQAMDHCSSVKLEDRDLKQSSLHKWPYIQGSAARVPTNSQDVLRLLKSLQPLLQDAIQKKRTTRLWDPTYTISGPLTWKDFHKLAGRGVEEACEPQPIPALLVGYDKEWLSFAPQALKFWDKLLLEPHGKPRDIAYVVVAPDSDFLLGHVKKFFKELSTSYELMRLGKHCPIAKVLRDGIMRVGKTAAKNLSDQPIDSWFTHLGDGPVAGKLRLYAQACRHHLAPQLATQTLDKSLFECVNSRVQHAKPHPMPSPHPHTPNSQDLNNSTGGAGPRTPQSNSNNDDKDGTDGPQTKEPQQQEPPDMDGDNNEYPSVVVYVVDPFTYGNDWEDINRLSTLGLLRCYQEMLTFLPEQIRSHVKLQIVPLQTIMDHVNNPEQSSMMRTMAFSVFTQCGRNILHQVTARHLTGFGPAAAAEKLLKERGDTPYRIFSPPFVLGPQSDVQSQLTEACSDQKEKTGVLFCGYCLSEDQRWLLAVCTDDTGELMETRMINIEIPNRNRRKKASARKIGLQKLWEFILGVISSTGIPWRLVVGRFGRIGHGELKGWSGLLSKSNLVLVSKQLRDMCGVCGFLGTQDTPSIMSACLISMEPQSTFHIMTDNIKIEEQMSSNCPLSTPRDSSVTHILVFPTSSRAQTNVGPPTQQERVDITDYSDFGVEGVDLSEFADLKDDIDDIGSLFELGSPVGSPRGQDGGNAGSPGHHSTQQLNGGTTGGAGGLGFSDPQDETPNLLQQPLAMGYYISTASRGPMPKWFWSACPQSEDSCPSCFKAALHIHNGSGLQGQDELYQNPTAAAGISQHPLDSGFTCDVLRYVLESYNALSWLTMDPTTNDRRSCLPIHFVVLMQLYHAMNLFV